MGEIMVHKVTLSSGKVVLIREMKIRDQELAAKAAGNRAGDNQLATATIMQKELVKLLVVQIGDKKVGAKDLEDLDAHFTFQEYGQITRVVNKLLGDDGDQGNLTPEIVPYGNT